MDRNTERTAGQWARKSDIMGSKKDYQHESLKRKQKRTRGKGRGKNWPKENNARKRKM